MMIYCQKYGHMEEQMVFIPYIPLLILTYRWLSSPTVISVLQGVLMSYGMNSHGILVFSGWSIGEAKNESLRS